MQASEIISRYEQIFAISTEMVVAAQASRWDDLVNLEIARREPIQVVTAEPSTRLDDVALQIRKESLIRSILTADEQVKLLTVEWMSEMQGILMSVHAERKLAIAYETG